MEIHALQSLITREYDLTVHEAAAKYLSRFGQNGDGELVGSLHILSVHDPGQIC